MPRVSHRRTPASFPAPGAHRDELLGWLQRELIRRNAGSSRLMGLMDDNRSGTASFNEFATGLCAVDVDLERDDYMRLFKAIDMNGDRMLSLREVAERLYATQYPPPRGDTWGGVRGGGPGGSLRGSPGSEAGGADEGPMRTGSEADAIQNFRESVRRFPELLPGEASGLLGTGSLRMQSKPTVSTNRPLRRQRSRRIVYRNEARLKPITRTSSEPQFKVLSGDLIKSASTSYLMQNAALKSFVGSIKASKQRRDDKSTVLRPYDMAKARVNANKIFVYDPDSEAQHASTVGNDSINFVPCNPAQAKVLCSHDVDGHSSHSRNTTYASVPFEDAEDARREVARDSRSRWLGESFRTSSTTKSKHLMQANYFLYSPDTETQTLERECLQQQTLRNVARFKARKKPQLQKETVKYLREKHLRDISPFHTQIMQEYDDSHTGEAKFRAVVEEATAKS